MARLPLKRATVGACAVILCLETIGWQQGMPAAAADPAAAATPAAVAAEWETALEDLKRRAAAGGHEQVAEILAGWDLPSPAGRQAIFAIPSRIEPPADLADDSARRLWDDFLAARRNRAAGTFAQAITAARAQAKRPGRGAAETMPAAPLQQQICSAVELLYGTLRDDPNHARAREAGGWVRRGEEWVWPEAARRLSKREEFDSAFGWLPQSRMNRYRAGERFDGGRWLTAEAAEEIVRPLARGWKFESDHWQIKSTASLAAAAELATHLEQTHDIWRQVFGAYCAEPAEWEKRLEGRGRVAPREPFAANLLNSRTEYVEALEQVEPAAAQTLGLYWTPTHTAWFAAERLKPEAAEPAQPVGLEATTIHHEAVHQLFAEMRPTSPLAGERCGFWAIEAAACYLESLEPARFGWTLGGIDAGRVPAARERLLIDGFYVPLEELTSLGRRAFQADERLPAIYSQIAGMADFFMNGQRGLYREAFVEYLVRIYTGTVDPDTLARLCKRSYAELDAEYRRHLSR